MLKGLYTIQLYNQFHRTMVNETIQYYIEKGGKRIYLLLIDATKAFDKVSYKVLFDILLKKKCMP